MDVMSIIHEFKSEINDFNSKRRNMAATEASKRRNRPGLACKMNSAGCCTWSCYDERNRSLSQRALCTAPLFGYEAAGSWQRLPAETRVSCL